MASSAVGILFALLPRKALERILPPVVSGVTVVLIGTSLADLALKYWGGGNSCAGFAKIPNCQ
eukprot:scaffold227795_cov34-Prasinocladus_malaysianus.AAC.1